MNSIVGQGKMSSQISCPMPWRWATFFFFRQNINRDSRLSSTPDVCMKKWEKNNKRFKHEKIENLYSQNSRQNSLTIFFLLLLFGAVVGSLKTLLLKCFSIITEEKSDDDEDRMGKAWKENVLRACRRRSFFFLENEKKAKRGRIKKKAHKKEKFERYDTVKRHLLCMLPEKKSQQNMDTKWMEKEIKERLRV